MLTRQTHNNNKYNANVATTPAAESVIIAAVAAAEQSIKLCNEAVSLFFAENCSNSPKHFQTAIIKLSKALIVVKQHKASRQKQAKHEQQQRFEVSTTTVFDIDALFPLPQPSTQNHQMDGDDDEGSSNKSRTDDSEEGGENPFVYNHLISLPPPLQQVLQAYEGYASSVLTIIQIVITFNLALVYHLLGLTSSSTTTSRRPRNVRNGGSSSKGNSTSSPVLRVAMGLYEDALSLFQEQHQSSSISTSNNNIIISTTAIFRLATLNNLSNICNLVGDETSEQHYLSQLLSTTALMTTSIKTNPNKQKVVVDPQRYEHFFESSMSLVCPVYGAGTA